MTYLRSNIYLILLTLAILTMGSCNVSKFLAKDQYLVKKNKIEIQDIGNSRDDVNLAYNLSTFVIQKPNTNHIFTPREWLYFKNKEAFEAPGKKRGRVKEAQKPVLHNDELMFETAERMQKYLRFSKGFYHAKVYPKAFLSEKKAEIVYVVVTDKRYKIRSKEYFCEDKELFGFIQETEDKSLLKVNENVDEAIFEEEKTRIFQLMQDKGYASFSKNNIEFKADSSNTEMDIFVRILPPQNSDVHKKYSIGEILVYPNYRGKIDDNSPFEITYKGKDYAFTQQKYFIKPATLDRSIQLQEGTLFRKKSVDNTYASLANLGTYRFINITTDISTENDTVVNYNIFLTPIDKTWATDASINAFYTFLARDGGNINRIGLSGITSLSNINTFQGGEKFSVSAEATSEFQIPNLNANLTFKLQTSLTYPVLVDYKGISKRIFTTFLDEDQYIKLRNNTETDVAISYSYVQQINQYKTHSIIGSLGFEFQPNQKSTFVFTPVNINSLSTDVDPQFRMDFLDNSPLFARSFDKRFITTLGIPQILYLRNSPLFSSGFKWSFRVNTEISGAEITAVNALYNLISGNDDYWAIDLGNNNVFEFSRFGLIDSEITATQIIRGKHSISGRFHAGIAIPFFSDDVIPFIRQFYVGGANSLRAWQTRELGPGAYYDPTNDNVVFFQSGDIVLEASLEYRFPIYYLFEGALFVDAGNVWTLRNDTSRPGSQFKFDTFTNQIAIGHGIGVRLNLDFLIIRLDMGYKLRYPYSNDATNFKYWNIPKLDSNFLGDYLAKPNYTIGLNYPF